MSPQSGVFPIRYRLQGGRPGVDVGFEVLEDGACTVEVLSPETIDQRGAVRVGRFRTQLSPSVLQRLVAWAKDVHEAKDTDSPSGSVWRYLSRGDGEPFDVLPNDRIERDLMAAAKRSLKDPLGAVEIGAKGDQLIVRGLGDEGFRIVLFDNDDTAYYGSIWRDDPHAEHEPTYTDSDAIDALIEQGKVPEGPVVLKRGDEVTIPLPPDTKAGATGRFTFWRSGQGEERRTLTGSWSV